MERSVKNSYVPIAWKTRGKQTAHAPNSRSPVQLERKQGGVAG